SKKVHTVSHLYSEDWKKEQRRGRSSGSGVAAFVPEDPRPDFPNQIHLTMNVEARTRYWSTDKYVDRVMRLFVDKKTRKIVGVLSKDVETKDPLLGFEKSREFNILKCGDTRGYPFE